MVTLLFDLQPLEINSTSTRKRTLSPRIHQVKVFLLSKALLNLLLVLQSLPKVLPCFTDQDKDLTMVSNKLLSIREIEALGKESNDKKSIWFKKDK
jgi:hypothetical protein